MAGIVSLSALPATTRTGCRDCSAFKGGDGQEGRKKWAIELSMAPRSLLGGAIKQLSRHMLVRGVVELWEGEAGGDYERVSKCVGHGFLLG